jgi:hypothetical protein
MNTVKPLALAVLALVGAGCTTTTYQGEYARRPAWMPQPTPRCAFADQFPGASPPEMIVSAVLTVAGWVCHFATPTPPAPEPQP